MIVCCQLSLEAISAPEPSCSSNVGSANASGTPYGVSSGPIARIITFFEFVPVTMKPPIITLSPVWTNARVLMLPNCVGLGAQYLLPVLVGRPDNTCPPQTIISLPVQTAV